LRITEAQVRYVADLANLRIDDTEVSKLRQDLDGILEHVDKLKEIDTEGVAPMSQVLFEGGESSGLRDDTPAPSLGTTIALANAPQPGAGHFKVPKIIER
jgi:aspartyl-tRNA(Asn)/glutamyl-tRNA(Gln) amidotransferase subunit C